MSSVDFEQTAEDHCRLLILVKQVGCHLKPKSLNFVYDCISKVTSHQVASPPRTIYLKYLKQYQRENSEWGDFQAHRKVLGLVCIGKCDDVNEVGELYKLHEDLKEQYSGTLYDSRLILLGLKQDGSAIEKRLRRESSGEAKTSSLSPSSTNDDIHSIVKDSAPPKIGFESKESSGESSDSTYFSDPLNANALNGEGDRKGTEESADSDGDQGTGPSLLPRESGTSHVICYPGEENCAGDLEIRMQEFVLSLFWVLESKRMDRRSLERHDRMALLTAPFEKKDMVGVDTDTRMYRKRCQGRLRKFLGDLCLLAGVPSEAMAHYQTASDILRSSADWLWLGAAYEGICAATVIMAKPPSRNAPKVGFQRNLSFSMQRGVSVQKEVSKLRTATLGRNFSNGFDLSEVRNSATPLPDDIIEKYRETVQQYAKFRNAGVVELEASLKACRVLVTQNKYLAAADFLQNVVYINIIMITEEEKTNRFSVLAELYDQLGMHRKAGFFRRISAMQSVSPANPKPGWPYCYRTLLQALSSFHLSLDPKDHKPGVASGWPVAQLRVLHDLIVSARKMGNPAIAIRHLTYLLHTMIEHLSVDEIKEMASILESYTSRCEGTPQALALDDGTILPPVPLLKFPTVKSLKLLNLPPHLRPVKLSKNSSDPVEKVKSANNPFIYSPLQIFKASSKTAEEKCELDFCWVQGDVCETSVFVSNPLPFELHCSNLGLLTEGIKFESYPSSLSLPAESGPFHVKLTGVPKESGSLVVHGYTTNSLGVRSHCRLRDMPQIEQNHYKIKVVPPLPQLQVSTSLPKSEMFSTLDDSDSVVTSASASLFAGERCECNLRMVNVGKQLSAEVVNIVLDSKVDQNILHNVLRWNEDNLQSQLPLLPDSRGSLTLYINGVAEFVIPDKLKISESSQLDSSPSRNQWHSATSADAIRSPLLTADGSWCLEALLRLQYSGGEGMKADFCRHCSVALNVEVKPSLRIADWQLHPGSSSERCVLVLDMENTSCVDIEVDYCEEQEKLPIEAGASRRFGVEISKCNILNQTLFDLMPNEESAISSQMQSDQSRLEKQLQRIVSNHVCDAVHIKWTMPSIQRFGSVSLDSLWWTTEQMQLIQTPLVQWSLKIGNASIEEPGRPIAHSCGQPLIVEVQVTACAAICDVVLEFDIRPDVDEEGVGTNPEHSVCLLGAEALGIIPKLEENCSAVHSCSVVFLTPGLYIMDVLCTAKTPPISVGAEVGEVTERWSYTPSVKFNVEEDEEFL